MTTPAFKPAPVHYLHHHEILENLIDVKPGDHLRVIYGYSPLEQIEHVAAYLKEGIAAGEQCIYMADDITDEQLTSALRAAGIDVDSARDTSSILIWTRERWQKPGVLDTIRKAAQVRELTDLAMRAGFTGVRVAVEMIWTLRPDFDPAETEAWETHSDSPLKPGAHVRALCLFERRRLNVRTMVAGNRTRPTVIDSAGSGANGDYARRAQLQR